MSLARLVVVEGPDTGREFELPMRGGAVGRGEGSLVQLTDPTVSRQHGMVELRDGVLCWVDGRGLPPTVSAAEGRRGSVDDSARPRALINGKPSALHALEAGDEIVIGTTKLVYLPVDGVAVTKASSHVTMEVGSRQLLALIGEPSDHRARRHLAAIAQLGDRLRAEASAHPNSRHSEDAAAQPTQT